ncbi:MAG: tetratricopeptide repeat protein [Xenococcaceae cyanobacterium]
MNINFYDQNNQRQKKSSGKLLQCTRDSEKQTEHLFPYQEPIKSEHYLRASVEEKAAQGHYAVAIALLNQLIQIRPDSAVDYNNRGLMHFRNNQLVEALADLTRALTIDPKLDSAYNNRANCHAAQGNLDRAISDYDRALDLNPGNIRAWINQGITFREMGMYDLAIENFDIALVLDRNLHERIYGERGRAYHLRGDWNCAVADYQQAMTILLIKEGSQKYLQKVENWLSELLDPLKFTL